MHSSFSAFQTASVKEGVTVVCGMLAYELIKRTAKIRLI
jgi:hypothetical protein